MPNLMDTSTDLHVIQRVCSGLELGYLTKVKCRGGDMEPVSSSGDHVDNEKDNSPQEINHRVHKQEHVLEETTPDVGQK